MRQFRISRNTIRQAMADLEGKRLLLRERGRGTFVCQQQTTEPLAQKQQNSSLVGILSPSLDSAFRAAIVNGAEEVLAASGYQTLISLYRADQPEPDNTEQQRMITMTETGVAGMIVFPSYNSYENRFYPQLKTGNIPFVLIDSEVQGVETDLVLAQDEESAYQGTQALIQYGCRRIAFICGYFSASTSRERYSGFQRALWKNGLAMDSKMVFEGNFTREFGYDAIRRLLVLNQPFDGIFIANHTITEGAVKALMDLKPDMLDKVRICSFGEPTLGAHYFFPIIVVRQPLVEMGRAAATMLVERIEEIRQGAIPKPSQRIVLAESVIVPDSLTQHAG